MNRVRYPESLGRSRAGLLMLTAVALSVAACDHDVAAPQLPVKLAFTEQPRSATAGAPVGPVAVTVEDAAGHPVSGVSDTVTVALARDASGATLAGPTTETAAGGVATFDGVSVAMAGSYTLVATAPGYASARSAPFTVSPGAAARLAFVAAPATAQGQVPFAPAVQVAVKDTLGNTVTSATGTVTLAIGANPNGGTLAGTATAAASGGVASFTGLSIDNPGSGYTLVATSGSLPADTSAPFPVHITFASVSAGGGHTCGVTPTGAAYCWGYNGYGELGTGNGTTSYVPVAVRGGLQFATVRVGSSSSCGVTTAGVGYCWGFNADGELGDGGTTATQVPTAVSGALSLTAVTSGAFHSCALTTTGAAYCWGANNFGQLGNGTLTSSVVPVAVSGGLTFSQLAAGGTYTCGLTAAGTVYCWGNNGSGQLGNGTTTMSTTPVQASSGSLVFASVTTGLQHTCALTTNHQVYCWGYNADGEFGDSVTTGSTTPVQSSGAIYLNLASVSAGQAYTCGVAVGGAAYCWGAGVNGQLGDGSTAGSVVPVAVLGGVSFTALATGALDACGITAAGAAYCWGYGALGTLGDGVSGESFVPVKVSQ